MSMFVNNASSGTTNGLSSDSSSSSSSVTALPSFSGTTTTASGIPSGSDMSSTLSIQDVNSGSASGMQMCVIPEFDMKKLHTNGVPNILESPSGLGPFVAGGAISDYYSWHE